MNLPLFKEQEEKIQNLTKEVFKVLGCSGFARVDFLVDNKTGRIIDIIDGFKCETLESILEFKRRLLRPKDLRDIEVIESVLKKEREQ